MTHLVDTNICSALMRRPGGLAHRFFQYAGGIAISTVVLAELYAGAYQLTNPSRLLRLIDDLLDDVQFGKTRGRLLQSGIAVPTPDLMVAAVALVHDLTLVTHNIADFRNVPDLRLEDWLAP